MLILIPIKSTNMGEIGNVREAVNGSPLKVVKRFTSWRSSRWVVCYHLAF